MQALSSPLGRSSFLITCAALLLATGPGCSDTGFEEGDGGTNATNGVDGGAGGGDGSISTPRPSCPGQETTISGTVFAPNGVDPVPGATVFIPASVPELFPPEVKCEVCGTFGSSVNLWFTTSDVDGTFTLDQVCPGSRTIVLQNGRFRRVVTVDVPASTTLQLTAEQSRLPRKKAEGHLADSIPKIAVATGDFDKMECVLRKIGLEQGSFDLYEGAKYLKQPGGPLPYEFKTLVGNLKKMKEYNIIFINCTADTFESELTKPEVRQNVKDYVQAGGRLYVTDWSYDWIEQIDGLSPFIDFEPGVSPATPEGANKAALGAPGLTVQARVKDPKLEQWLALFPGTVNAGTARVEHFLVDWVMMHQLHEDVNVWVEGDVKSRDGTISGSRPLTVTFNFENCGKILFSSYHTEGRDDELPQNEFDVPHPKKFPDYCGASASPQDRILEFLIFDIANCVEPIK